MQKENKGKLFAISDYVLHQHIRTENQTNQLHCANVGMMITKLTCVSNMRDGVDLKENLNRKRMKIEVVPHLNKDYYRTLVLIPRN